MKKYAKLFALALTALALSATAFAAFEKVNTYSDDLFTDVPSNAWYASEVKSTYELGLMNGKGDDIFAPTGNVTVAEAITMASRAAAIYYGEEIPSADGEWYKMYVDYGMSKGFVKEGQFDSLTRPAKRYEVATLFENAMPDGYYVAKNNVDSIPDVSESKPYLQDLLTLYKAGIVMGSDAYGNFKPEDNITRAEAAAIINRVALEENRVSGELLKFSDDDAYCLDYTRDLIVNGGAAGIKSGWLFDNRGGVPATDYRLNVKTVADESETEGVALIREFNKTTTGSVFTEAKITLIRDEGFYIEHRNANDKSIYRLEVKDGMWQTLNADGSYTKHSEAGEGTYVFGITVDLDNGVSTTVINGVEKEGELCLAGDELNLLNMRYASNEKGKAKYSLQSTFTYVNYSVHDEFTYDETGSAPYGWNVNNAKISEDELHIDKGGKAVKYFDATSGKVIVEAYAFLNSKTMYELYVNSGLKTVIKLTTDGKNIAINGKNVYEYYDGLWYRFRFELDTENYTALIKLNGRDLTTVPFAENTTSIDTLEIKNKGDEVIKLDNFYVFREIERDDYVPVPVVPKGEEKYNVGLNVCDLWFEGKHYGWSTITPFERPLIGYYDEGNPETADWEIKYLVEHGIDFQAICWFADSFDSYIKTPGQSDQLHNGFMNAKYSDMSHYALLLELNAKPASIEAWKEYFVPYFVENYFKDDRYMCVDNQLVVCTYGVKNLLNERFSLGSVELIKEAFDYLEAEVVKLGFDGVIYLSCAGLTNEQEAYVGIDASYHYNLSKTGNRLDTTMTSNDYNAKTNTFTHTVPTVSMGFNNIGWGGERSPIMTIEDYAAAQKWVKETFLPTYGTEGEWSENFVMLSTWNEYGEGTYIMPCENNHGFGYLDAAREAYTDEKKDESLNTIPTEEQARRINRRYPQYRQLVMSQGVVVDTTTNKQVIHTVDAKNDATITSYCLSEFQYTDDGITATATGEDPRFMIQSFTKEINTVHVENIRVTFKAPKGSTVELFFKTSNDGTYGQDKKLSFTSQTDEMQTVNFKVSANAKWTGNVTGLYFDPIKTNCLGKEMTLKTIEFVGYKDEGYSKTININGLESQAKYSPVIEKNGDVLVPFDLKLGLEYRLDTFCLWDKATQSFTISSDDKTVVFTVGSKDYTVDGNKKSLAYEFSLYDGLPLVPMNVLCAEFGYKFSADEENGIRIDATDFEGMYDDIASDSWEFNLPGYLGGWKSDESAETAINPDGYLEIYSDNNDPRLTCTFNTPIDAKKYMAVEIAIKFEYEPPASFAQMFYKTTSSTSYSEDKSVKFFYGVTSITDDWWVKRIDLTQVETWKGKVTELRFDPFGREGWMHVDYIRLIEDPNYVEEEYVEPEPEKKELIVSTVTGNVPEDTTEDGSLTWTFNNPDDETNEGWENRSNTVDVDIAEGGYLELVAHKDDPSIFFKFDEPLDSTLYNRMKIRVSFAHEDPVHFFTMYWVTDKDNTWGSAEKQAKFFTGKTDSGGGWFEATVDLTKVAGWKDNIVQLRFDPPNPIGLANVDYIKLYKE